MSRPPINFEQSRSSEIADRLSTIDCKDTSRYFTPQQLTDYLTSIGYDTSSLPRGYDGQQDTMGMCRIAVENKPVPGSRIDSELKSEEPLLSIDEDHPNEVPFFNVQYIPQTGSSRPQSNQRGYDKYGRENERDRAWQHLLEQYDEMESWTKRIDDDLETLNRMPTGKTILRIISTFYAPGEITVTNVNPSRISANVHTSVINIPSVPRKVCYFDPAKRLASTESWIVLGHELIHLIHFKLGIHFERDPASEEENTIQGKLSTIGVSNVSYRHSSDPSHPLDALIHPSRTFDASHRARSRDLSLFEDRYGQQWRLTENQFRKESGTLARNGYGSIPVCAVFNKDGCQFYKEHGDRDTCAMLDDRSDPKIVALRRKLEGHR